MRIGRITCAALFAFLALQPVLAQSDDNLLIGAWKIANLHHENSLVSSDRISQAKRQTGIAFERNRK
ncbi:hypothetical protein OA90_24570 [Labrenzia sp. OB1]|nr:hypothetical protein OA90_24570 [Labrenzia sp. OB1]